MLKINIPETDKKRVVIVGGGFAGLSLARKLIKKKQYQVVLIDKNNYHQFQPLFYQVAMAGLEPSSIVFPFRKIFQNEKDIHIRVTEVEEIQTEKNCLITPLGICKYDYLVLATGAVTNYFGNEVIAANSISMKSVSEALFLRNQIFEDYEKAISSTAYDERQEYIDIVIVGGGPTGVEVAGALADMKKFVLTKDYPELDIREVDIWLIQGNPELLTGMSENASEKAKLYLEKLGVNVVLNTRVIDYDGKFITLENGKTIPTKKVIWAAGVTGNFMKGFPQSAWASGNRLKTNAFHQVEGFSNIFAIGDLAFTTEEKYPKGHPQVAQVAIQQAKNLGNNLQCLASGKQFSPFSYRDLGSMATIGRNKAVADFPGMKLQGWLAWVTWLFVHLFQILGAKNKLFVFMNWVWNYITYDQPLRLIIKPKQQNK